MMDLKVQCPSYYAYYFMVIGLNILLLRKPWCKVMRYIAEIND